MDRSWITNLHEFIYECGGEGYVWNIYLHFLQVGFYSSGQKENTIISLKAELWWE